MFNSDTFNQLRREAQITSAEFADFAGISRREAYDIELCKAEATPALFRCLQVMITQRKINT